MKRSILVLATALAAASCGGSSAASTNYTKADAEASIRAAGYGILVKQASKPCSVSVNAVDPQNGGLVAGVMVCNSPATALKNEQTLRGEVSSRLALFGTRGNLLVLVLIPPLGYSPQQAHILLSELTHAPKSGNV